MVIRELIKKHWFVGTGITLFAVVVAQVLSVLPFFEVLELRSINSRFDFRGQLPQDTSIVIVAIDDASFAALPEKWPYPRSYYAKLVENLTRAEARLIIFDIEFTESSTYEPGMDLALAKVVTDVRKVILAGKIVADVGRHGIDNSSVLKPISPLLRSGVPWGIVNVPEDVDGFIRKYLIYQMAGSERYYSIGLSALFELVGSDAKDVRFNRKGQAMVGNYRLQMSDLNTMWINYRGPVGSFRSYSFSAVLDDSEFALLPDEDTNIFDMHRVWGTFRNKIVIIGASAEELQDNKYTPFFGSDGKKRRMPGVEVHANALSTILRSDYLHQVDRKTQFFILVLVSVLTVTVTIKLKAFKSFLIIIAEILGLIVLAILLFNKNNLLMAMVQPVLAVLLGFVTSVVHLTFTEQREKRRYRDTFKHYVAPNVVDQMLSSGELPKFGGERKELTILFSDIRSFTSYSERHEAHEVVNNLSEYLTEMVDVILRHNGTLDKFVGDEIMAVYGAPYYFPEHAEKACRTAIEMVKQLREIQKRWSAAKKDFFHIGIGINSGTVIAGNLGSRQLFDYTVIGDEVNIAARLEGANKQYETTIIISEQTYNMVKPVAYVRELDRVRVVGREKPICIYELRSMDTIPQIERDFIIDVFTDGLVAYRDCRWYDALREFRRVLRYFPSDGPAKVYTKRCLDFIENPPPADWDGVYEFKSK